MSRLTTPGELKLQFQARGETIADWAAQRGFNRSSVYAVLDGRVKGFRGQAHRIAVALGLKAAVVDGQRNPGGERS